MPRRVLDDEDRHPGAMRRIKHALRLSDDATELEVLAALHDLRADGWTLVRESDLERLREEVREAREQSVEQRRDLFAAIRDLLDERRFVEQLCAALAGGRVKADEAAAIRSWWGEDRDAAEAAMRGDRR